MAGGDETAFVILDKEVNPRQMLEEPPELLRFAHAGEEPGLEIGGGHGRISTDFVRSAT